MHDKQAEEGVKPPFALGSSPPKDGLLPQRILKALFPQFKLLSVTVLLVLSLLAIFLIQALTMDSSSRGPIQIIDTTSPPFLNPNEGGSGWKMAWEMISSSFVHFDYFHLLSNVVFLFALIQVEATMGPWVYLTGLLTSAFFTSGVVLKACRHLDACDTTFGGASTFVAFGVGALFSVDSLFYFMGQKVSRLWYISSMIAVAASTVALMMGTPQQRVVHGSSLILGVFYTLTVSSLIVKYTTTTLMLQMFSINIVLCAITITASALFG